MKALLTLSLLLSLVSTARAQDSIRTVHGNVIAVNIKKVTPFEVSYSKHGPTKARYSNNDARYLKMSTSKIAEIIYADGRRDTVLPALKQVSDTGSRYFTQEDFYALGEHDARLYYRRYGGAATGTFLATFPGSPLLGLCVATATSFTPPSPKRFTYPNTDLLTIEAYKKGYAERAHSIKAGKAWSNWLIGTAVTLAVYGLVSSAQAR